MSRVYYKEGYKYQTQETIEEKLSFGPKEDILTDYIKFLRDGTIILKKGYAWDGATCFPDFKWIIRGSAVHDAGYQLLRLGLLPPEFKDKFDRELQTHCSEDGPAVLKPVYYAVYQAVARFGGGNAMAGTERPILVAP